MKNRYGLSKKLWCRIHGTSYCPNFLCKEFWGCQTVEAERRVKLNKIEENKIEEEVKKKKDFNKMCEENYNKMIKKLLKDPLIKKIVKELNEKEVKKLKYFETKIVKVKKEMVKCSHSELVKYLEYKGNIKLGEDYQCKQCKKIFVANHIEKSYKQPKGNFVNGENLDKIKFPCFCSYGKNGEVGFFSENDGHYYIAPIDKQKKKQKDVDSSFDLKKIIKKNDIHILKGKITIFEE